MAQDTFSGAETFERNECKKREKGKEGKRENA